MAKSPKLPEIVIPRQGPVTLPEAKSLRRWWEKANLSDCIEDTTVGEAMRDVSLVAFAHLMRRMTDESTPDQIKDTIALLMAPKAMLQIKGGTQPPKSEAHDLGQAKETQAPLDQLLAHYELDTKGPLQ